MVIELPERPYSVPCAKAVPPVDVRYHRILPALGVALNVIAPVPQRAEGEFAVTVGLVQTGLATTACCTPWLKVPPLPNGIV